MIEMIQVILGVVGISIIAWWILGGPVWFPANDDPREEVDGE